MKPAREPPPPRGATGRADLLRLLATAPRDHFTLEHDSHGWFGYVHVPREEPGEQHQEGKPAGNSSEHGEPARKLPLQRPTLYGVITRGPAPAGTVDAPREYPAPLVSGDPRAESECSVCQVQDQDLLPRARLMPALRAWLGSPRAGGIDMGKLIRQVATLKPFRHLPRRRSRRWHPDLVVVFDFSEALWPYRHDMQRLKHWLIQECGRHALSLRIVEQGPSGPWREWGRPRRKVQDWEMPPPGAKVLIVGDLGQLTPPQAPRDWLCFIAQLRRARVEPLALVPLGAGQIDPELAVALPQLRWSPDAPVRPQRPVSGGPSAPPGLDELLAMCAAVRRVDPALLRALRRVNPIAPLNAGLEGALWNHPDVASGGACDLNGAAGDPHRLRFAQLPLALQEQTHELKKAHHLHLRAVVRHEETLLLDAHAHPDLRAALKPELDAAQKFVGALVSTLRVEDSGVWHDVVTGLLARADAATAARNDIFQDLAAACYRPEEDAHIPAWVDMQRLRQPDETEAAYWLLEDAASGHVLLSPIPPGPRQSAYGSPLTLASLDRQFAGADTRHWFAPRGRAIALADPSQADIIHLRTVREHLTLGPLRRPRGAVSWGRDSNGLFVRLPYLGTTQVILSEPNLVAQAAEKDDPDQRGHLQADPVTAWTQDKDRLSFGIDLHGAYADLDIAGIPQRLRWIEPGEFWMGSPEDEAERVSDEGPRHRVLLTRGFWLADSACTQALWQAVMRTNPSRFKQGEEAPRRPVERVSWDDVQDFLGKLQGHLPGAEAVLPTEAQWEYACRSGTQTPFSFGANITPEQVNYDGNYPYAGGKEGQYRQTTVPVKSLPANDWGLYEMHGNVWEWCADDQRHYEDRSETDPEGASGEGVARRVVRGGSWVSDAGRARSAYRSAISRDDRDNDLGFRFALRSPEPGPEAAEPLDRGAEGRSPTVARSAAPARREAGPDKRGKRGQP